MRIALYQPDIPQNLGAVIRIAACFDMPIDIIEPCGFPLDMRQLKRIVMDYGENVNITRHQSFEIFGKSLFGARLILLTTKAEKSLYDFSFQESDVLLFGRESAGVPEDVASSAQEKLKIPISQNARSLNLHVAVAVAASEGRRQLSISSKN